MLQTPILLITFNRSQYLRQILTEIGNQQPSKLYVFQDGMRIGNRDDELKMAKVRQLIEEYVNWPCDLPTNYQDENLGCGRGPFTAISWFLSYEEYGIILEDDIIPHPIFFDYMRILLERYKDDERIGIVAGHNLHRRYSRKNSYYFTFEYSDT